MRLERRLALSTAAPNASAPHLPRLCLRAGALLVLLRRKSRGQDLREVENKVRRRAHHHRHDCHLHALQLEFVVSVFSHLGLVHFRKRGKRVHFASEELHLVQSHRRLQLQLGHLLKRMHRLPIHMTPSPKRPTRNAEPFASTGSNFASLS